MVVGWRDIKLCWVQSTSSTDSTKVTRVGGAKPVTGYLRQELILQATLVFLLKSKPKFELCNNQSVTYRYREFLIFLEVSEKIGTGKKSRNRYRKNLVPEKGLRTGIGKIWYRSRFFFNNVLEFRTFIIGIGTGTGNFSFFLVVSEPVSEKFGTGKKYRNRYR